MKKTENQPIDFVVTWVDGADPKWQKEKEKYSNTPAGDKRDNRYRDWDLLKYWFRAVETYAPWVNKVHFVTCGQIPEWLNINNPKLHLVNHSDYIPEKYLPTFNSVTIELFLHKIPELAENFVYFNDDMFLNSPVKPEYFFKNNLPCDTAILSAITPSEGSDHFSHCLLSNTELLEKDYNIRSAIKKNIGKWINPKYGSEQIRTLLLLPWHNFTGVRMHHMPISYKKSTFEKIWKNHKDELEIAASDKFRNNFNLNHWIFRYDQLLSGNFQPQSQKQNSFFVLNGKKTIKEAVLAIQNPKVRMLCINDNVKDRDFLAAKKKITKAYNNKLLKKSSFEK